MRSLSRRAMLGAVGAVALAAVTGCRRVGDGGPARSSAAVTTFTVWDATPAIAGNPSAMLEGGSAMQAARAGMAQRLAPVVTAFNDGNPGLRAHYATDVGPPGDPRGISCLIGPFSRLGTQSLEQGFHQYNVRREGWLPGLQGACTDQDGQIVLAPLDFQVRCLGWSATELAQASVAPPASSGWSVAELAGETARLRAAGYGFGPDLGWATASLAPTWLGFVAGYGGDAYPDGRVDLTSADVRTGLEAYASLLAQTWMGTPGSVVSPFALYIDTAGDQWGRAGPTALPWSARFPRMPVSRNVPAVPVGAQVPPSAPDPASGAAFAAWLMTPPGQEALASVGYPSIQGADPDARPGWLRVIGTSPQDLVFTPVGLITVLGEKRMASVTEALALQDPAGRLAALRAVEDAATAAAAGDTAP